MVSSLDTLVSSNSADAGNRGGVSASTNLVFRQASLSRFHSRAEAELLEKLAHVEGLRALTVNAGGWLLQIYEGDEQLVRQATDQLAQDSRFAATRIFSEYHYHQSLLRKESTLVDQVDEVPGDMLDSLHQMLNRFFHSRYNLELGSAQIGFLNSLELFSFQREA